MTTKFNKFPSIKMPSDFKCNSGWNSIYHQINEELAKIQKKKKIRLI